MEPGTSNRTLLNHRPRRASVSRVPLSLAWMIIATLLASGLASGHGGHGGGYQASKLAGKHYVTLEISQDAVLTAKTLQPMTVYVLAGDGSANMSAQAVRVTLTAPDNETTQEYNLSDGFAGSFSTRVLFPQEGTWTANVSILPDNASAEFSFPVYAANPYAYSSPEADARSGMYVVDQESTIPIEVIYIGSGLPAPEATDATALLERWTDDHKTKLSEREVPLRAEGPGRFVLETTFDEVGMYHVFVASPTLKLEYDDRPYVHITSVTREQAQEFGIEAKRETPVAPLAASLLAVAAVARATRRRT